VLCDPGCVRAGITFLIMGRQCHIGAVGFSVDGFGLSRDGKPGQSGQAPGPSPLSWIPLYTGVCKGIHDLRRPGRRAAAGPEIAPAGTGRRYGSQARIARTAIYLPTRPYRYVRPVIIKAIPIAGYPEMSNSALYFGINQAPERCWNRALALVTHEIRGSEAAGSHGESVSRGTRTA
jgi:hypothetical protein